MGRKSPAFGWLIPPTLCTGLTTSFYSSPSIPGSRRRLEQALRQSKQPKVGSLSTMEWTNNPFTEQGCSYIRLARATSHYFPIALPHPRARGRLREGRGHPQCGLPHRHSPYRWGTFHLLRRGGQGLLCSHSSAERPLRCAS